MKVLFCEYANKGCEGEAEVFRVILYKDEKCNNILNIGESISLGLAVSVLLEGLDNEQIGIKCGAGEITTDTGSLSVGEVAECLIDHTVGDCPCKENNA